MSPLWSCLGLCLLLLVAIGGCGERASPEQQIRALIEKAEQAAESRSSLDLMALVAADYLDADGRDHRQLSELLAIYLYRHRTIHLLVQVQRVELSGDRQARVVVYAAIAGSPIAGISRLRELHADLLRFDLGLRRQQEAWLVEHAAWRPANWQDFME